MISVYKELLPGMGGYLTHAGNLDRNRLQLLLGRVGQLEQQVLEERAEVSHGVQLRVQPAYVVHVYVHVPRVQT